MGPVRHPHLRRVERRRVLDALSSGYDITRKRSFMYEISQSGRAHYLAGCSVFEMYRLWYGT